MVVGKMTRREKWLLGKPGKDHDEWGCGAKGCQKHVGIREFDCGFFCFEHYFSLPSCTEEGCDNPVQCGKQYDVLGRCRSCEFDYSGEYAPHMECAIVGCEDEAPGNYGIKAMRDGMNAFMIKHKIKQPDPLKGWRLQVK